MRWRVTFFDVDPQVVADAGRRTAATATSWEQWACQSEIALRNAASDARQGTVTAAIEGYLSSLNPAMQAVAKQVDALGVNTTSASASVANSDTAANTLLSQHGVRTDHDASVLRRSINR